MTGPFERSGDEFVLVLDPNERSVLQQMPELLAGDDAGGRLSYVAHSDDPDADARYQELVSDDLAGLRRADRNRLEAVLGGETIGPEDVEAFMRVIGEVRLVLAARLGIEDDGWEADLGAESDPELALLGWLGYLQDAAVGALTDLL